MSRDDRLLHELRLTRTIALQWAIISSLGFLVFVAGFYAVYVAITGQSTGELAVVVSGRDDAIELVVSLGLFLGLTLAIVVPHELVHGWAMKRYGATPEYGVGVAYLVLPYAYARSDAEYTRDQTLVVLLAPLVVLSIVGLGLMVVYPTPWLVVPLAANAAGSIGDVWMALVLLRYPPDVRIVESSDGTGIRIYGDRSTGDRDRVDGRSIGQFVASCAYGATIGFGAIGAVTILGIVGSLVLGFEAVTFGIPGSEVFLFRVQNNPGVGASTEFGISTMLATSVAFGIGYAAVSSIQE